MRSLRSFIPKSLTHQINLCVGNATITTKIIRKAMSLLHNELRTRIWLDRCQKMVDWESRHNITSIQKRTSQPTTSSTQYRPLKSCLRNLADGYSSLSYRTWIKEAINYGFS